MMRYARTVPAVGKIEFIPSARSFSNFDFVEDRFGSIWQLRRILSQVRMHDGETIVVEHLQDAADLAEENADLQQLCPAYKSTKSDAWRLSFFRGSVSDEHGLKSVSPRRFLGYAIVKKDVRPQRPFGCPKDQEDFRIYESVVMGSRHENNYIRGGPTWRCRVAGREMQIEGYLYAQQNGITNSCAHVAVRTAATRFLGADLSYQKMNQWVREFRTAAGLPAKNPGAGLSSDEICHILHQVGAGTFMGDYTGRTTPKVPYERYLYGAIESGFPAILFFETGTQDEGGEATCHAVPVFGHTFNEDTWVPDANRRYFPMRKVTEAPSMREATKALSSGTWVSMFVGHDDNAGSNYCIPQNYIEPIRMCTDGQSNRFRCKQQQGGVAYAIGSLPSEIKVDPIEAEAVGADYLLAILKQVPGTFTGWTERWQKRLEGYHASQLLVLRTILVKGAQYATHLGAVRGWAGKSFPKRLLDAFAPVAADWFWMVELSVPELFSANRRKIGEILIRADTAAGTQRDFKNFVCARLPGCFALLKSVKAAASVGEEPEPTFLYVPVGIVDHVELFGCEEMTASR
jgi:hypothetical protein